jgi:hypothetical protein
MDLVLLIFGFLIALSQKEMDRLELILIATFVWYLKYQTGLNFINFGAIFGVSLLLSKVTIFQHSSMCYCSQPDGEFDIILRQPNA